LPSAAQIVEAGKFEGVPAAKLDARKSGAFKIGGDTEIHRLGFGAMRITGKGIWGPPEDRPETLRTLKRVPELGIVHRRRRLLWPGRRGAESDRACLGVMLPIPGTSKVKHLEENVAAVDIQLSDEEYAALDRAAPNTPRLDAPHCLTGGGTLPVSCP
jgi:hypothetical protein